MTMGVDDDFEAKRLGLHIDALDGEAGYSSAERRLIRPTLELTGIWGGFREEGIKTVLPSEAHVKVSFRFAKGQDPDAVWNNFEDYIINTLAPKVAKGLTVTVQRLSQGSRAYFIDENHIGMKLAGEVLDEVFPSARDGDGMHYNTHTTFRQGSSVSAVAYFKEVLDLDTIALGFASDADDLIHAPGERFRTQSFKRSQRAYIRMIMKCSRALPEGFRNAD